MLIVISGAVSGCEGWPSTPRERLATAEQTLQAAAETTQLAVESGLITDRNTLLALKAALQEGNAQVARAHDYVIQDKPADAQACTEAAISAARRALRYVVEAQANKDSK